MKKLFVIALSLIATGTTAMGATNNPCVSTPDSYSRPADCIARGSYHTIRVEDDIDVVLTETNLAGITVVATDKFKQDVNINVVNGVLKISSKRNSLKNKAIVYVPVTNLEKLVIEGGSHVTSSGYLNSPLLKVFINGEASFEIRNHGEVVVDSDNETELHVDKKYLRRSLSKAKPHSDALETSGQVAMKL